MKEGDFIADSYWRDREKKHIEERIKEDKRLSRRLRQKYIDAMEEIQEQIELFYSRYADKERISMSEARKRVSTLDMKKYSKKAKKYVKERNFSKTANDQMRIYNLTMRINRLQLLRLNIELELLALISDEERFLMQELTKQARAEFERQAGILSQSLSYPTATVESIVNASFLNATWSDRLWQNQDALRAELDRLLTRGIVQGLNPRALARELRQAMDAGVYNSERLLRTELSRVQGDVFKNSMEQADYHAYEYIAEPTACKVCSALDGKIFKLSEMQVGKNMYPTHPNCRCSTASAYDRRAFERDLEERGL